MQSAIATTDQSSAARGPSIPMISVEALRGSDARGRQACGQAIDRACRDVGFFYVVNHGVDADLIGDTFAVAREFFGRPASEKMQIEMARSPLFRGYFPLGGEITDPAIGGDAKEGFDIALELPPDDPDVRAGKPLHGANQWPAMPPRFRAVLLRYYERLASLGSLLSTGFALALDLPADFFAAKVNRPTAILRVLHYPPPPPRAGTDAQGCAAHSDYGYVTILAQDDVGGLQIQTRAGEWLDVAPIAGAFVCNIGELMSRWTNDTYAATKHRVISASDRERYSIPFFFHPNYDVEIACLPSCQGPGKPPRYAPVRSGDYVLERQINAYAKV
jgi:isopenicillin N synthase-like dioxygenase